MKRGKLEAIISGDNSVSKAHLQKIREIHEFLQESTNAILTFKRNELGIEVLTQIVIQLMMVMLSPKFTVSATHSGLQALFESDDSALQFWLGINGIILILGSIGWSFKTTAASYVNVKTEEKIEFYPMLPKLVLGVRTLLIVTVRICCTICYFAPFLGLMDSLAHWKADQLLLPGDQPRSTGIPEYTDYTLISLGTAFLIFLGAMVVQSIIILFVKRQMNGQFRKAYWSCKLQHIVEVFNMPGKLFFCRIGESITIMFKQEVSQPNSKHLFHEYLNQIYPTDTFLDWDTRPGSPAQHKRRWEKVISIFLVANIGSSRDLF